MGCHTDRRLSIAKLQVLLPLLQAYPLLLWQQQLGSGPNLMYQVLATENLSKDILLNHKSTDMCAKTGEVAAEKGGNLSV